MSESIAGVPVAEINEARAKMAIIKIKAFDMLRHIAEGTYDPKTMGYKSLEDALIRITKRTQGECEKIIQTLERKYP